MRNYPEIRIRYAWLLKQAASEPMNELWGEGHPLLSDEEYEGYAEQYRQWWKPYESKILTGMCDLLNLEFRQNTIDVYVAPWFRAFSDPMVLGVKFDTEDKLVSVLTHELIHRLLTDNTTTDRLTKGEFMAWREQFGERPFIELVHIPVHAVLKAIYIDVLHRPDLLRSDIERSKQLKHGHAYSAAWEYVESQGYNVIIEQLKQLYRP